MNEKVYTIHELKSLISESASEFKAKIGDNVVSKNKSENKKSYTDAEEKRKQLIGDKKEQKVTTTPKEDGNKTMLDYDLEANCGDDFKDKVKAQAEGYTSVAEKNNKIEKAGEFSDKVYKELKKAGVKMANDKVLAKKTGLTARQLPDDAFKKDSLYKESKKISVLTFKNTTFLNEEQMIARIPDEYKTEGKRFKVKDCGSNEFIVEWVDNSARILSYENPKNLQESINKFQKLVGYSSKQQFGKASIKNRLNEGNQFNNILNKTRELNNKS